MIDILVKYHNQDQRLQKIEQGDWIDLKASRGYHLQAGEFRLIDLGVSMELPDGYEAHIAPRSSLFKNYGLLQTNSVGIIDSSYCGDDDVWMLPVYATRDIDICAGDRIAQFRVFCKQPEINFIEVDSLNNANRGGFGSTGKK